MSYGPHSNSPARKKGGGMVFLIVIAIAIFLMSSNRGGGPGEADQNESTPRGHTPEDVLGTKDLEQEALRKDILGGGGDFEGQPMPSNHRTTDSSDWSIEEVTNNPAGSSNKEPAKTTSGDWAIEEVDVEKKKNQFQFSNPTDKSQKPNTSSGGDWSIDDAGGEVKPKKKVEGDWSIEEAGE